MSTPLPPVPKTIEVTLLYSDGTDTNVQNKLFFTYAGSVVAADLASWCATIKAQWNTHMAAETTQNVALEAVMAINLDGNVGPVADDGGAAVLGTNTGSHLTSGAAFVVGNLGAHRYRGGHSRNYIPGAPNTGLADANTWTGTFQGALLAAWQAFILAVIQNAPALFGSLTHVIAHRFGKTAASPVSALPGSGARSVPLTTPFTEPVLAYRANPQVGSQRRRNQQLV